MKKKFQETQSSYELRPLPGFEYHPQGYEPRGFSDLKNNSKELHIQIYEKQNRNRVD